MSKRVVHCKKEKHDIYIGRPSKWGNPFSIGKDGSRQEVIEKYENWIRHQEDLLADLPELKDKVLGCWCKPKACHGDVLVKLLEETEKADIMNHMDVGYKQFSPELCQENDLSAKDVALSFLTQFPQFELRIPLEEQEEAYKKWDFTIYDMKEEKEVPVEVERKKVWKRSAEWQGWPTIDVPSRKSRSEAKYFVMCNEACDTLAITRMKNVLNAPKSAKKTIYTRRETFFNVPLEAFKFYHYNGTEWIKITAKG